MNCNILPLVENFLSFSNECCVNVVSSNLVFDSKLSKNLVVFSLNDNNSSCITGSLATNSLGGCAVWLQQVFPEQAYL